MTIAYMVKGTFNGSNIIYYFVLCFLSIPAIIYNSMTLLFVRSRSWGNAYAFAALDIIFTILWLSAFAAVAAWNSADLCVGACGIAKAMVGFGFFIFIFFVITSAISVYNAMYYRNHGSLPGSRIPNNASMIDPDAAAFSTAPHDEYAPIHGADKDDDRLDRFDNELSAGPGRHPYEPDSYGYAPPHVGDEHEIDTSYGGSTIGNTYGGSAAGNFGAPSSTGGYRASSVAPDEDTSYGGASGTGNRIHFPQAPY